MRVYSRVCECETMRVYVCARVCGYEDACARCGYACIVYEVPRCACVWACGCEVRGCACMGYADAACLRMRVGVRMRVMVCAHALVCWFAGARALWVLGALSRFSTSDE